MDWPLPPPQDTTPIFITSSAEYYRKTGRVPAITSTAWQAGTSALVAPVRVRKRMTVKKLYAYNGAAVSGNCDIGLYSYVPPVTTMGVGIVGLIGSGVALNPLTRAGSTAQSGTSTWQIFNTPDIDIAAGTYCLVYIIGNTSGRLMMHDVAPGAAELGNLCGVGVASATVPLGAGQIVASTIGLNIVPMLALGGIA